MKPGSTKPGLGVGLVGHAFMGAAHSQAWRTAGRFFDLPWEPDMAVGGGRRPGGPPPPPPPRGGGGHPPPRGGRAPPPPPTPPKTAVFS